MKKRYQRLGVMGLAAVMACTGTVLPVLAAGRCVKTRREEPPHDPTCNRT